MKKLTKDKLVFISIVIVVLLSLYLLLKRYDEAMNFTYQEISLEEARNQLGLKIYEPSYLPEGMRIDVIERIVEPKREMPTVILTIDDPLKEKLEREDEISISQSPVPSENYDLFSDDWFLKRSENANIKYISIQGKKARVMSFEKNSDIINIYFLLGKTSIDITGHGQVMSEEQLIKIAESMVPKE